MMNRKQRRKTKQIVEDEYTQSTKSIIITLVVVLVVFALFYGLTLFINDSSRKLNTKEPEVVEPEIGYLEILGDNTFIMSPHEYYVLFYDFEGPEAVYFEYLINKYSSVEGQYIYMVDLSKGFNSKFVSKETNKKAKKAGDLKVKDATLIKIEKGKNVEYTEGSSQVIAEKLMK